MPAEVGVTNEMLSLSTNSETTEDTKNVLFQLKTNVTETTTSEPTVPFKSSSEILSELFGAFNAEPPTIPDSFQATEGAASENLTPTQDLAQCDEITGSKKIKSSKVSKSRKHKHKTHKHKKRRKKEHPHKQNTSSSSGNTKPSSSLKIIKKEREVSVNTELGPGLCDEVRPTSGRHKHNRSLSPVGLGLESRIKKERVKTKYKSKSHRKRPSSAITVRSVKFNHAAEDPEPSGRLGLGLGLGLSIKISNNVTYNQDPSTELISSIQASSEPSSLCTEKTNKSVGLLPEYAGGYETLIGLGKIKIEPGTEPNTELSSPSIPITSNKEKCGVVGQSKTTNKISIKSLKFSSVFEATVREVEEQAKAKADKYEEGEISNSDSEELVLSPISSVESDSNIVSTSTDGFYITREQRSRSKKYRKRHHSASHHHSSKRRKKSSENEKGLSVVLGNSCKIKHTGSRSRNERKTIESKKQRDKHQHVHNISERHRRKSSSCSLSPEPGFVGDLDKKFDVQQVSVHNSLDGLKKKVTRFSGKNTVEELTNFCKELSRHEHIRNMCRAEGGENYDSDSETERPFHHPFQVKERPQSIVVNIRNSIQLPVKSFQEKAAEQSKQLRLQFPVSSGQHHRKAEDTWVPVSPKRDSTVKHASKPRATDTVTPESVLNTSRPSTSVNKINVNPTPVLGCIPGIAPVKDIGSIVSQKLRAMRTLQENPGDVEALGAMFKANQDMLHWAEAKQNQIPPLTGAVVTSAIGATVTSTVPSTMAPTAVSSGGVGMGMSLLQKMGWRPGEGLGKNREGTLEPLKLEIKMDKKGLATAEDLKSSSNPPSRPTCGKPGVANRPSQNKFARPTHNINQPPVKHPINQLVELCMRNRWKGPHFELCHESGPDHRKNFLFKVLVNGTEYKSMVTSLTKKQAKTEAAGICLQALRDLRT